MQWLIWPGVIVSLAGLAILLWCVTRVISAKRRGMSDEELRKTLQHAVGVNLAAFLTSILGLLMIVTGLLLG
ncbi:hypothetical protein [Roseitranquillus sediminis]|uniref:hypothetical protein n=1 Tax=Roseitranquillus sediminis TaxID=2809051 RepID=UPI001D0BFADB|nr:hypothetical protein [Roseitranquillus sediminis]MBM9595680.1 hypothetical protein [Roseitranquillus sediminis]